MENKLPIFLLLYIFITIIIAFFLTPPSQSKIYGKKSNLITFIASFVTSWYGAIIASGEFVNNHGVSAWFSFCLPYHICLLIISIFFIRKIFYAPAWSVSDFIFKKYGPITAKAASLIIYIYHTPAIYVLMICELAKLTLGINYYISLSFIIIYQIIVMSRGFQAIKSIQYLDFILMFTGFSIIFYKCIMNPINLAQTLPEHFFTIKGKMSLQQIFSWYFIAFISFISPYMYHSIKACKTYIVARNGLIISVICFCIFDFFTIFSGIYSKALFPSISPSQTYIILASHFLNSFFYDLFILGLFSIIISAMNGHFFVTTKILEKDILNFKSYNNILAIIITSLLSIIISIMSSSVLEVIYTLGSIFCPAITILVIYALLVDKPYYGALICFVSISLAFLTKLEIIKTSFEPAVCGLLAGALTAISGHIFKRINNNYL